MPESFGASFVGAYEAAQQARRQSELDKQNKIQQSIENALRLHSQEQEQQRIGLESQAQKQRALYEEQDLALRREQETRLMKQQQWTALRDEARLRLAEMRDVDRRAKTVADLKSHMMLRMSSQKFSSEDINSAVDSVLGEYYSSTGMSPQSAQEAPVAAGGPITLGRTGEGGISGDGKKAPITHPLMIKPSPMAELKAEQIRANIDTMQAMKPLKEDLAKEQIKERAATTELTKARTRLTDLTAKMKPAEFKFRVDHDKWEKMVANGRLSLDQYKATLDGIKVDFEQDRMSETKYKNLQEFVRWTNDYALNAWKARQAAATRVDSVNETRQRAQASIDQIMKIPEGQRGPYMSDLIKAHGIVDSYPDSLIKQMQDDYAEAEMTYQNAVRAKAEANVAGKKQVTPRGRMIPPAPIMGPLPGLTIRPMKLPDLGAHRVPTPPRTPKTKEKAPAFGSRVKPPKGSKVMTLDQFLGR